MDPIVTVTDFEKSYGDFKAVRGISFQVEPGTLFAFLGPNGAGKSTTIDTLCTLLRCQKGHIQIAGYELGRQDKEIRRSIGVVFQQSLLDIRLTVRENLMTRGAIYGFSREELKRRVAEVAKVTGTEEILDKYYGNLSGGQMRRADIARALINRPKLLFMDEPMTGLDPKSRENIWSLIGQMKADMGMTVFLTTHYMEEAANADKIVVIKKGLIVEEGTPGQLKNKYTRDHLIAYGNDEQIYPLLDANGFVWLQRNDELWIEVSGMQHVLALIELIKTHITNFEVKMGTMDEMFINIVGRDEVPV